MGARGTPSPPFFLSDLRPANRIMSGSQQYTSTVIDLYATLRPDLMKQLMTLMME